MPKPIENVPSQPESPPLSGAGRRRLLRGGLGAAPLLMTLVSRPVLGNGGYGGGGYGGGKDGFRCTTPSGFTSMPSSRVPETHRCDGGTPGYWKQEQHFKAWPAGYYPKSKYGHPATKFSPFFALSPYSASTTFLDVLEKGGGPPDSVARHIVAAVLNAERGWSTVLSVSAIKNMWYDYRRLGFFEPTAGVRWYHDQIQNYLESTMQRD